MAYHLWTLVSSSLHHPPSLPPSLTPSLLLSSVQSKQPMSEMVIRLVFVTLIHSAACLHSMLDPNRVWKRLFITDNLEPKRDWNEIVAPTELVPFFTAVFTMSDTPLHYSLCSEQFHDLQLELLHMMGGLLSSFKVITTSTGC